MKRRVPCDPEKDENVIRFSCTCTSTDCLWAKISNRCLASLGLSSLYPLTRSSSCCIMLSDGTAVHSVRQFCSQQLSIIFLIAIPCKLTTFECIYDITKCRKWNYFINVYIIVKCVRARSRARSMRDKVNYCSECSHCSEGIALFVCKKLYSE